MSQDNPKPRPNQDAPGDYSGMIPLRSVGRVRERLNGATFGQGNTEPQRIEDVLSDYSDLKRAVELLESPSLTARIVGADAILTS